MKIESNLKGNFEMHISSFQISFQISTFCFLLRFRLIVSGKDELSQKKGEFGVMELLCDFRLQECAFIKDLLNYCLNVEPSSRPSFDTTIKSWDFGKLEYSQKN